MNKIKIDVKQASQFIAAGYEIECYVNVPKVVKTNSKRHFTHTTAKTHLALSLDGQPPVKGKYKEAWDALDKALWKGDLKMSFARSMVQETINKLPMSLDNSYIPYLINQKKCLRVIEA